MALDAGIDPANQLAAVQSRKRDSVSGAGDGLDAKLDFGRGARIAELVAQLGDPGSVIRGQSTHYEARRIQSSTHERIIAQLLHPVRWQIENYGCCSSASTAYAVAASVMNNAGSLAGSRCLFSDAAVHVPSFC